MQEDQPGEEDKKVKEAGLVTFDRSYTAPHQTPYLSKYLPYV
jgi:hypothetical protein